MEGIWKEIEYRNFSIRGDVILYLVNILFRIEDEINLFLDK